MEIPQLAPEPYAPGDQVRTYLDPAAPDAHTHGTVCELTDVLTDDLETETGRSIDAYSYRLRDPETDAEPLLRELLWSGSLIDCWSVYSLP
jgi:hypothetical protein